MAARPRRRCWRDALTVPSHSLPLRSNRLPGQWRSSPRRSPAAFVQSQGAGTTGHEEQDHLRNNAQFAARKEAGVTRLENRPGTAAVFGRNGSSWTLFQCIRRSRHSRCIIQVSRPTSRMVLRMEDPNRATRDDDHTEDNASVLPFGSFPQRRGCRLSRAPSRGRNHLDPSPC